MPWRTALHAGLDMAADHQVLLDRQVHEDAAAFEHLDHAAPHHVVRRQPVEPLTVELIAPLVTWPRSARSRPEIAFSVVVLPAPLAPSSVVICALARRQRDPLQHQITPS